MLNDDFFEIEICVGAMLAATLQIFEVLPNCPQHPLGGMKMWRTGVLLDDLPHVTKYAHLSQRNEAPIVERGLVAKDLYVPKGVMDKVFHVRIELL